MEDPSAAANQKALGILSRLQRLEESQHSMMDGLRNAHKDEMAALRAQLEAANERRRDAEAAVDDAAVAPVLMEVNMKEIDAAVQAASYASQESAAALEEAREVAENARLAAGGIPQSVLAATKEGSVGYGADNEYIVKRVNVNLDDVERIINSSPLVNVCRAFGRPDSKYGNEVYCAVVPKRNVRVSEPMLATHALKYLPTAMVPKRFFFLEDLPSGITRKALADTHTAGDLGKRAPQAAIENGY